MIYMPSWPIIFGRGPIEPGTERITEILRRLGNPHHHLPPVIHVAGTNGKGSTIAYLRAMLTAASHKAHVYTSPHLLAFNERIVLAGEQVHDSVLLPALEECRAVCADMQPTFFEGTTAAAFLLFSRYPADILLMETGMGGRLDPTNVIPHPIATVITPISMDHKDYLGPDIKTIAGEKAGIFRAGTPFIMAPQPQDVTEVLSVLAHKQGAPLFRYGYEWYIEEGFRLVSERGNYTFPAPNLPGLHQITNAATAVATLASIEGFSVNESAIAHGLTHALWPARLQPIAGLDTPADWEIWLDGAHNQGGAEILRHWVDDQQDSKPLYVIVGTTKGKDLQGLLAPLADKARAICGVKVHSEPRSYNGQDVADMAESLGMDACAVDNIAEALTLLAYNDTQPARVLIYGSLFLAGDIERMRCDT